MKRVAVCGATGYAAAELIRILLRHPQVSISLVTSREEDKPTIGSLHRTLQSRIDLRCELFSPDLVAEEADVAFLCMPHGASIAAAKPLLARGVTVIDLSADYRLRDPAVYQKWYGEVHDDVDNLKHAVYGLPEFFEAELKSASLIANPGCYPSSAIFGLAPLAAKQLIDPADIVIDSKSGVSGAGRSPKLMYHFPECNESLQAYGVGTHRHTPEIAQVLSTIASQSIDVIFTPHLVPMDKGILSTIYARPKTVHTQSALLDLYREFYRDKPFIRVVEHLPTTKDTVDTNFCDITVRAVGNRIVVISCLDNLIKGAAGAAVQNFNVRFGFPQTTALLA